MPIFRLTFTFVIALAMLGCDSSSSKLDPAVVAGYREQFVSPAELPEPVTVEELRAKLQAEEPSISPTPVVLIGQVGGIPNPLEQSQPDFPWQSGSATFFLVDRDVAAKLAAHLEAQGPDHQDCPFCARAIAKSADSMVAVNFNDKQGKPIPIDAKELFELKEKDAVVVEGDAMLLGGKMLVVDARRIHVQR